MFGTTGTKVLMSLAVAGLCGGSIATGNVDLTVISEFTRVSSPDPSGFSPADWEIQTTWGSGGAGATQWPAPASIGFEELSPGSWVVSIFMPNWVDDMPIKHIRGSVYLGSEWPVGARAVYGEEDGQIVTGTIELTPDPTDPLRLNLTGRMTPNPDFETLEFTVQAHPSLGNPITGFYIETESIPAPGSVALVGLAACTLTRRRR
jgi:hypothetical protein